MSTGGLEEWSTSRIKRPLRGTAEDTHTSSYSPGIPTASTEAYPRSQNPSQSILLPTRHGRPAHRGHLRTAQRPRQLHRPRLLPRAQGRLRRRGQPAPVELRRRPRSDRVRRRRHHAGRPARHAPRLGVGHRRTADGQPERRDQGAADAPPPRWRHERYPGPRRRDMLERRHPARDHQLRGQDPESSGRTDDGSECPQEDAAGATRGRSGPRRVRHETPHRLERYG
ncbi:hypothetical protein K466DRAFT_122287 [Polyporus arcularius HHB13444]|uniref:Uncharacterized protein n=1 Tax=Polyporus arcularius HHB13444 TaxID=1314778 RepID=A0A5C3PUR1_9APHY|nr:hypothetical protein K466DRAFT_122287 [Polyporus arcularius HHB13444]